MAVDSIQYLMNRIRGISVFPRKIEKLLCADVHSNQTLSILKKELKLSCSVKCKGQRCTTGYFLKNSLIFDLSLISSASSVISYVIVFLDNFIDSLYKRNIFRTI